MASGVPRPTSAAVPVGDSELAADPSAALELYGHGLRGGPFPGSGGVPRVQNCGTPNWYFFPRSLYLEPRPNFVVRKIPRGLSRASCSRAYLTDGSLQLLAGSK